MEGKKKSLNVSLIQGFLDAASKVEKVSAEMLELESTYNKAVDEAQQAESAVIADSELMEVLKCTGIRTLSDKLITVDMNGLSVSDYVPTPAMWEFKGND